MDIERKKNSMESKEYIKHFRNNTMNGKKIKWSETRKKTGKREKKEEEKEKHYNQRK